MNSTNDEGARNHAADEVEYISAYELLDINRELVRRGAAWFYPEYAESDALYEEEQGARSARAGLWALPADEHVEPWEWRRRARESQKRAPAGRRRSGK